MRPRAPFATLACALLAWLALAALPSDAAARRAVAVNEPRVDEAAYQQLVEAANAVVGVKVKAMANAKSSETLGDERQGSGIIIGNDGLVLTFGYHILEADTVDVSDSDGQTVPATVVAYDHTTGFGLVRAVGPLSAKPIKIGTASPVAQLDRELIVTGGADQAVSIATVVSRRRCAGYWEYLIDGAIFTSPPRLDHSGAALINKNGELIGVGSLFVMDALTPGEKLPGNMFVPIDLLKPVLDEMIRTGTTQSAQHRPWLGVNSLEEDGRVKVLQVNDDGPAAQAGIEAGDIILAINGRTVEKLEDFYNMLWNGGEPGVTVRLSVLHGPQVRDVVVQSMNRKDFVKQKPSV